MVIKKRKNKRMNFIREFGEDIYETILNPLIPKFNLTDILQIIIGASILAVPVGFTEETWRLGETLPWLNVIGLLLLSIFFITLFTNYQYHRKGLKRGYFGVFFRRVFFTYFFSFLVVALIMTIIQRAPWSFDLALAVKRVIIVTFPSSLSAVLADTLK